MLRIYRFLFGDLSIPREGSVAFFYPLPFGSPSPVFTPGVRGVEYYKVVVGYAKIS